MHGVERDGDVLFPYTKEAADANDQTADLAVDVDDDVVDGADLVLRGIIDARL